MFIKHKIFHFIIVSILFIQLVIGTPFTISVANEVIEGSVVLEHIEPVENTIMTQETVESYPLNDIAITEDNTIITYTESSDTNTTNVAPEIIVDTIDNQEVQTLSSDTGAIVTYIETNNNDSLSTENTDTVLLSTGSIDNNDILSTETTNSGHSEEITTATGEIENNIALTQSSLITSTPQKTFVLSDGLIDPLTIDSYNVRDENSDMTFCSYVSYLNLKHITTLSDESLFMRGDAVDIWSKLTLQATLSGHSEIIFTGTNISGQQFIDYLTTTYFSTGSTLFDIVTLKPKSTNDDSVGLSLRQSHRFVIFLGTDYNRYVLDPIRVDASDPILLVSYLEQHIFDHEDIKIIQSYELSGIIEDTKEEYLTTGHIEDAIVVHSPMEFLPYVLQGLISAPNSGDTISNEVVFHTGFRYETIDGSISAHIPAGLVIKTADGRDFNPFTFTIQELSGDNNELSTGYNDSFKFGIDGQHLVFSRPIGLTLQTPEYEEHSLLDLMVQHEGQDWNKQGLTIHDTTTCLPDGSVAEENQLHTVQVQSGKVMFYTCGASSFALGYVPGLSSPNNAVVAISEQADGKIIIGGSFTTVGGVARNRIARLNADKSLDLSFNPNLNNTVIDIKIQPDGKILVAGTFTGVGATVRNRIARLHQDGTVDSTFNPNSNNVINDMEIQSDGKIFLGGAFTTMGGTARNYAARVTTTGLLDTTFNATISTTAAVNDIEVQADGNVLLGGTFITVGGVNRNRIARVTSTGALDTTFNPNALSTVNDMQIQSDGMILVGGAFTTIGGATRNRIARLTTAGVADATFNPNANNTISTIAIQSDNKIVIGGVNALSTVGGITRNSIARINSDGSLDTAFNPNSNNNVSKIIIANSGKIIMGGSFTSLGGVAQAYLAYYDDIILDTVYNVRPNAAVSGLLLQPDGKILIGGAFTTVGGTGRNRMARLNEDNTLDQTFNPNLNGTLNTMAVQSDNKILIGGAFTTISGTTRNYAARLTTTGALDTTFNATISTTAIVNSILEQSDGTILLGGTFTTVGGVARNRIARVTTTGLLDTTFDPNANNTVSAMALQPDGSIIVGGAFTTVGGVARNSIARITSTGLLDTTFNPNANNTVNAIILQPDGKILIGGTFTTIGGTARNRVARLNSDGTLDTTFNPNASSTVSSLYLLDNGDMMIGGAFTTMGGVARLQLAKVSSLGVLDTAFNVPFSASTSVATIIKDSEGNLVVGGTFTTMSGNANNTYMGRVGLNSAINNMSLWMRADTGTNCTTDGCAISQWNDNSNFSNHAIQSTGSAQPIYKTNVLNGNPVINFNTNTKYLTSTMTGSYRTVFAVRNLASTGYQYLFSAPSLSDFSIRTAAGFNGTSVMTYTDGPNLGDWSNNGQLAIDGKVTNTGKTRYHIVKAVASSVTTNTYSISTTFSNRGMYGNDGVAEMIVYNTGVDSATTNKIESYLSIKYGITLDQSTTGGQNYTLSNNTIAWSTGSAGVYTSDIAGIAKDTSMNLAQGRSQSINNTGDIIVETEDTIPDNLTSLIWANNAGSTGFSTTELPSGITERIAREWKFQEKNGDIGTDVSITYPIATGLLATGELALMVDTDGDFTNGGTTLITGSIVGGYRTFTTNLADNSYISFGIVDNGDVCIEGPDTFDLGTYTTANIDQTIIVESNYFQVSDQKGGNDGYYTTLSVSNLTGTSGGNIISSASNIQIIANTIDTLSGTANPSVILDNTITSYISANTPVTFIKRDLGTGVGIKGIYGSTIRLRLMIPAYQRADTYTGTITYTLYEN